jgi:hypothetical protein
VKWEYMIWEGERLTYATLEPLGADGWELVAVVAVQIDGRSWNELTTSGYQAVFKRPKAEEAKP